jgi:ABC-type methionine transport system ATPase subunit
VILADEPVSALDPRAAEEVLTLLADVAHADGLGVLTVLTTCQDKLQDEHTSFDVTFTGGGWGRPRVSERRPQ